MNPDTPVTIPSDMNPYTPVTIRLKYALRIAELLDYLSDTAESAEASLDGEELAEHQRERISARHWARELRDAVKRQSTATSSTGSC